jgi:peptidoglycan/xylan/chitin deacetylase (PgdA/CDA1 family)
MVAEKMILLLGTACLLLSAAPNKSASPLSKNKESFVQSSTMKHSFSSLQKTDTSSKRPWKNKKCAVVIIYDDAINEHLDNAIPVLDSLGLKATFYLTAYSPACVKRLKEWRGVAASGHELGNHTSLL